MKLIASLLIGLGLAFGTLAASTAYLVPLSLADNRLIGLELKAPAGIDEEGKPLVTAMTDGSPTVLNAEHLQTLRDAEVKYVRVRAFSVGRWAYGWAFALSALVLVGGAALMRADAKRRAGAVNGSNGADATAASDPHAEATRALGELRSSVDALLRDRPALGDLVEHLGEALATHGAAFIDTRDGLIARHGLGGYAELMDAFAGGERALNRAWSAAADRVEAEARISLQEGANRLSQAASILDRLGGN